MRIDSLWLNALKTFVTQTKMIVNIAAFEKAFQNNKDKLIIVLLESSNPFAECELELANVVSKLL